MAEFDMNSIPAGDPDIIGEDQEVTTAASKEAKEAQETEELVEEALKDLGLEDSAAKKEKDVTATTKTETDKTEDKPLEIPERFKDSEGNLDTQRLLKSYNELNKGYTQSRQEISELTKPTEFSDEQVDTLLLDAGIELPDEKLQEFTDFFKGNNFTPEQATAMVSKMRELEVFESGLPSYDEQDSYLDQRFGEDRSKVENTILSVIKNENQYVQQAVLGNAFLGEFIHRLVQQTGGILEHPTNARSGISEAEADEILGKLITMDVSSPGYSELESKLTKHYAKNL